MSLKFGTSGLRGLVTELTDSELRRFAVAFLTSFPLLKTVFIGRDLRPSSLHLANVIAECVAEHGVDVIDCGAVATPALALAAMAGGAGAIMVTGSHIPADRNGLKFYSDRGEITKADEAAILAALDVRPVERRSKGSIRTREVESNYVARYVSAFGPGSLSGQKIGVYTHSAVGRDTLLTILRGLGAEVVEFGRSDRFIPVDTEAVDVETRKALIDWAASTSLDALVSMDGDSDRPLLADATGEIIPGDILGQIAAKTLGARAVVTPITSNSGLELGGAFASVVRTRIGSPYVIEAMEGLSSSDIKAVGYEANGGLILGFTAQGPAGPIAPLMTRDAVLPIIAVLSAARDVGSVEKLVAGQPPRTTRSDRLIDVETDKTAALVQRLLDDADIRLALIAACGGSTELAVNLLDGVRITFDDGAIVHLRPSGNAPECRVYAEAATPEEAGAILRKALVWTSQAIGKDG